VDENQMSSPVRQKQFDVITFSDMCVDLILNGPDLTPQFGQVEKIIDDYTLEMGGSCNIFACQCAKLGLRTAVLGRVGDDSFGQLILQRLQAAGVDTRYVIVAPDKKTGLGVALCPPGDRAILTYLGSINALYPQDITDDILASTRHVHHGSFYLQSQLIAAIPDIFQRAHHFGASTSLDTNWDPQDCWSGNLDQILPHTNIFMPNDQEAVRIFESLAKKSNQHQHLVNNAGSSPAEHHNLGRAARYFRKLGVDCVTIKAGKQGAMVFTQDQTLHGLVQPVTGGDSIGAGDSFDGGFLAGWLGGSSLENCLQAGIACGRAVAEKIGGLDGQLAHLTQHDLEGIEIL
jgi:sugar/nucleoside kinase (ribokinase family)